MAAQQFLIKLTPYDVPNSIYVATVVDPSLGIWPGPGPLPGVGHPIALPGDPWWEGKPPGGDGGKPPRPGFPIALPPDSEVPPNKPGYPDYIWGRPIMPPPGEQPPDTPPDLKGHGVWIYTDTVGWVYVYSPGGGGKPRPPSK